ncbi:NXPE family member 3-like [Xiphophorus hellerii]|uniref:NXPE family member 3-like n=1 Tax=Xiphophorus hellerii TaxID=8084 RepID=UPI0013B4026D|nr:NXPE family member 3-like [Xiphophorus hellerii]
MSDRRYRNIRSLKYGSIFLFLGLTVLAFILYTNNLADLGAIKVEPLQIKVNITVPPKRPTTRPKPTTVCSFQSLSPQELSVLNSIKDAIVWPKTTSLPSKLSLNKSSDPAHSTFIILPHDDGESWQVGDQLEVLIKISDFHGRPKSSGGDFLLARLHNPTVRAGVAGRVLDHCNGSYTAVFPLLWEGSAQVEVTLVHSSEAVTVLQKLTQEQPDRIFFHSLFRSGSVTETTTCNVCLQAPLEKLCNYTDLHTGEPWFCYKPKKLNCGTRITHAKGGFRQNLRRMEEKLFNSGVNMKVYIPASGPANITVSTKPKDSPEKVGNVLRTKPSGYYYNGVWRSLDGTTIRQFDTATKMSRCLKGKVLHLYGDSTIRQWFEYLTETLPGLKTFDLKTPKQNGPFLALDYPNNILVSFRCHGPPIRFSSVPANQLRYIANELDALPGGTNTVIVIGIWSHFSTFPVEVYIRRLLTIRRAVERLLTRAPGTLVIIRTANPKALSLYETLTNSDWYSLQHDKVLRAIFKKVKVRLVDAWEMTLAHHLPHNLHPQPPIIQNMIDVVLSHVCPQQ